MKVLCNHRVAYLKNIYLGVNIIHLILHCVLIHCPEHISSLMAHNRTNKQKHQKITLYIDDLLIISYTEYIRRLIKYE